MEYKMSLLLKKFTDFSLKSFNPFNSEFQIKSLIPSRTEHKAALGVGIIGTLALSLYCTLRNQSTPPEYTLEQHKSSKIGFYVLHGFGNPIRRCTKIFANILEGRVFGGNPRHIIPGFKDNNDLGGLTQFANKASEFDKRIAVGSSCGARDLVDHVVNGTLPEGITGVIVTSPFFHTDDIADAWVPSIAPSFVKTCLRSVVSTVLWKYRSNDLEYRITNTRTPLKKIPILILATEGDMVVPNLSTRGIIDAMQIAGYDVQYQTAKKPRDWSSFSVHDYAAVPHKEHINTWVTNLSTVSEAIPAEQNM
jgi:hypothetical protein